VTYARKTGGDMYSTGWNQSGGLGNAESSTATKYYVPTLLTTTAGAVTKVVATVDQQCTFLQLSNGDLYAFGNNARPPYLGLGTAADYSAPGLLASAAGTLDSVGMTVDNYVYIVLGTDLYKLTSSTGLPGVLHSSVAAVTGASGGVAQGGIYLTTGGSLYDFAGNLVDTGVFALSKQPSPTSIGSNVPYVKVDGTLWMADCSAVPVTTSQVGSDSDWVATTIGYSGLFDCLALDSTGDLYGVLGGTNTLLASDVVDFTATSDGAVMVVDDTPPPPPPPPPPPSQFWTSFIGSHEVI
jgi:hypothetical protein